MFNNLEEAFEVFKSYAFAMPLSQWHKCFDDVLVYLNAKNVSMFPEGGENFEKH